MEVRDLTDESDSEVLDVFLKQMGPDDTIEVVKDGKYLHVSDNDSDKEFLIQTESEEEDFEYELEESEEELE
jgi:hypothetical protein